MRVLVTGGAGYIGSVVTELLAESGHSVAVFDDLRYGHREAVHPSATLIAGDLLDAPALDSAFQSGGFEAVVHLAAESKVEESVRDPSLFYEVNARGTVNLLDAMARHGARKIVFSSTASVYGEPEATPIHEGFPIQPINPYGASKHLCERLLRLASHAGLQHVSLRYFNACGASTRYGEWREKETHIIPILFDAVQGRRASFTLFGDDYPTADGTCVRDYIHVLDIAQAHIHALAGLGDLPSAVYNVGVGRGYSNREVIESVRRVSGMPLDYAVGPRRSGDPAALIADASKIRNELGWHPQFQDLDSMVRSAWQWRLRFPNGYASS
ncbi:MAG: UDP-glucose 4-epimerase GalE [Fimbriimonadaceae bacterium]|nr:UDP-glucose 4-epimerase GalE [Fimbriimonadaceae bacterium]